MGYNQDRTAQTVWLVGCFVLLTLLGVAKGHEHNEGDIPEGQTVSSDPIVRSPRCRFRLTR